MESYVTIDRPFAKDVKQRQMIGKVDGKHFTTLMHGQTARRQVEAGPYCLRVDNTWLWKNVELDLAGGAHIDFRLINRAEPLAWWMVALPGAEPMYMMYITIKWESAPEL